MKTFKNLVKIIEEDLIGTSNRLMTVTWLICLSALVGVGIYLSSESRSFLGVAESREQQISFANPVQIKHLHVISGQAVRKGELLMELDQSELAEKYRLAEFTLAKLESEKLVRHQMNMIVSNSAGNSDAGNDPLLVEIDDIKKQLEGLEEEKKALFVFASFDGLVGAVNFRMGERVSSFTTILTLSPESPTYVEGFVHESLKTKLEVGEVVHVNSSSGGQRILGKVVSVGSRIVLMPARLMTYPNAQIYGREVVVEIPESNGLLHGEKVQIKPPFNFIQVSQANASSQTNLVQQHLSQEPGLMTIPTAVSKRFSFEPSGAIYLDDLKKFLVISDDTDKQKSAVLFLVNLNGHVDEQTISIPGLAKVSDFESISQNGSHIYLMTSQGVNKNGKDKEERNLLVRLKRSGLTLSGTESVNFKPLLMKAIEGSADKKMKDIFSQSKSKDIEIESHFIIDSDLYVGFKEPLTSDNQSVILKIKNFDNLFSEKALESEQISLWNTIDFKKVDGMPHRISDLARIDGILYASTVCKQENCGAIWKLAETSGSINPQLVRFYKNARPEGVAFNVKDKALFITFDEKNEKAQFASINLVSFTKPEEAKK